LKNNNVKRVLGWRNVFFIVVGFLLLATFLFTTSDLVAVSMYIVSVNKIVYVFAFFLVVLGVVAYAASWYVIVRAVNINFSFRFALTATWSSIFFNLMIPAASFGGEFFRIYVVNRKSGVDYGTITVTVFLHRVITTLPFLTGSVIGFLYIDRFHGLPFFLSKMLMVILAILSVALIFAFILCVKPEILVKLTSLPLKLFSKRFHETAEKLKNVVLGFEESFKFLKKRKKVFIFSLSFAFVSWFFDVMVAYFVFMSLNYLLTFPIIVSVYTIGMTVQMIPVGIPGMVGVVESIMSTLYTATGVPINLSVAATLLIRAIILWFQILVGGILTFRLKEI